MGSICCSDPRRGAVRRFQGRNGLDYVELGADGRTLHVYFLGKLPPEFAEDGADLPRHLAIEGGVRITGLKIVDVDPQVSPEPDRDDFLVVKLDRGGDFSQYRLRLVDVANIDPHYAQLQFGFKLDCPSDLDCKPQSGCVPAPLPEPEINYLAKDYASFRQAIYDRLAVLMPQWQERHVPDLGVTLVELLAYAGDELSYYQDAVATEAYLDTARQRVSVRRHARLVDYRLHEGCNARVWLALEISQDDRFRADELAFVTGLNAALPLAQSLLSREELAQIADGAYEYFEPLVADTELRLHAAHNRIRFYTWGGHECCLPQGATRATLLDGWAAAEGDARRLQLQAGDVLIFEEVRGPRSGHEADADPLHRHAVRLTRVSPAEDPLYPVSVGGGEIPLQRPTALLEIEWDAADALPFPLCLSVLGGAPDCARIDDVSVARGNVLLADHGRSLPPEALPPVPAVSDPACCVCEGQPADTDERSGRYRPRLQKAPLVHREPLAAQSAALSLQQDPCSALPQLRLSDDRGGSWEPRFDLLASDADDRHFVAEIDNAGTAQLRFGDGELGAAAPAHAAFTAHYRIGGGVRGNVGRDAVSRVVLLGGARSGLELRVRNPLPAAGGIDPEAVAEAKLHAPRAFRKQLERAITADDYARLAERDARVQRASAELVWTGSWYEADVALDALGSGTPDDALLAQVEARLQRYRRMGHDLHLERAVSVPVDLALEVCALPGYERGAVKAALLDRFGARRYGRGQLGFFHPDRLSFGDDLQLSRIVAEAMAVPGVECVTVLRLQRWFEGPNGELEAGLLPLAPHEIARLEQDPDRPEGGKLEIIVRGGR